MILYNHIKLYILVYIIPIYNMQELMSRPETRLSDEQLRAAFQRMDSTGSGELSEDHGACV